MEPKEPISVSYIAECYGWDCHSEVLGLDPRELAYIYKECPGSLAPAGSAPALSRASKAPPVGIMGPLRKVRP